MRLHPALVGLLFSAIIFSGCVAEEEPDFVASFVTNWSSSAAHYFLLTAEPLPAELTVVILEKDTGVRQELSSDQIVERLPGKYDILSGVALRDGMTYRIEAFSGDRSVASREVMAHGSSLDAPQTEARAVYSFTMGLSDHSSDERLDMEIEGTMDLHATPDGTVTKGSGRGTMDMESEGMSMALKIDTFETEDHDDERKRFVMAGDGTWKLVGDASGSGQMTTRTAFLGRETKTDDAGTPHLSEKSETKVDMQGTITSEGEVFGFEFESIELEWARVDTGEAFWIKGTETTTITYPDGASDGETEEFDEPAEPEDMEPDLLDATDFSGLSPYPLVPGDAFQMQGLADTKIHYRVSEAAPISAAGETFPAVLISGTVSGGATGHETVFAVASGPLAGLPITYSAQYERGDEEAKMTMRLTSLN